MSNAALNSIRPLTNLLRNNGLLCPHYYPPLMLIVHSPFSVAQLILTIKRSVVIRVTYCYSENLLLFTFPS